MKAFDILMKCTNVLEQLMHIHCPTLLHSGVVGVCSYLAHR